MIPFTLRKTKGSPLTHDELDTNFEKSLFPPFLHIQDQKPATVQSGTFTAGAWRTRDLNTVLTNTIDGTSLSDNQITLIAGRYYVESSAPAYNVEKHKIRLFNITKNEYELIGTIEYCSTTNNRSFLSGQISINDNNILRLEHRCRVSQSNIGFGGGQATDFGIYETYSDIKIWRIGDTD